MHIIQLGRRWINLEYMICFESLDAPTAEHPAAYRVILESGIVRELGPDEGDTLQRRLAELDQPQSGGEAGTPRAVAVREVRRRRRPPSAAM